MQKIIEKIIQEELAPSRLLVENESQFHGGPATESHFKLTVVSNGFDGLRPVGRHQKIYALLADQLNNGVHALALHLYTEQEWQALNQQAPDSPDCKGGSKQAI
ncbi:MAG: transcriptional regulator [Gammaproteobacteria bacterium]|mgnify:CR=1 FL=1|jgi:BolA protein|nr:transcriptional regulator [Gammaproteobacteria bacterium]|tara:strand:- start:1033 stop:1344 length:312 start_codon:yes stop_codon:yes gene_type:complete